MRGCALHLTPQVIQGAHAEFATKSRDLFVSDNYVHSRLSSKGQFPDGCTMIHTGGLGNTITKFQTSGALETVIHEFDSQYISMTAREAGYGFRFSGIFYHSEYDKVPTCPSAST